MIALEKVGRTGGLFGELFSRPLYRTLDPFEVDGVIVPPGYLTDLVSAPWWARPILPLKAMREAAFKHDWRRKNRLDLALETTDELFHADLLSDGVAPFWAFVCWQAVRTNNNR